MSLPTAWTGLAPPDPFVTVAAEREFRVQRGGFTGVMLAPSLAYQGLSLTACRSGRSRPRSTSAQQNRTTRFPLRGSDDSAPAARIAAHDKALDTRRDEHQPSSRPRLSGVVEDVG